MIGIKIHITPIAESARLVVPLTRSGETPFFPEARRHSSAAPRTPNNAAMTLITALPPVN